MPSRDKGNLDPIPGRPNRRSATVRFNPGAENELVTGDNATAAADLCPRPPALATGPDVRALLRALRRRWMLIVCLGVVLAGAAGAALWLTLPTEYTAFSLLQVSSAQGSGTERAVEFNTYMKTQADRIKGRDVLIRTLSQDQVRNLNLIRQHADTLAALTWLENNILVGYRSGSELLTISVGGYDPNELTVLVNNLTNSYLTILSTQEKKLLEDRIKKTKILYADTKGRVGDKLAQRTANAGAQGAKDATALQQKRQTLMGKQERLETRLEAIEIDLGKHSRKLETLIDAQRRLKETPPRAATLTAKDLEGVDPDLRQDMAEARSMEKWAERMRDNGHRADDSTLVQTQLKVKELKKKIDSRVEELRQLLVKKERADGEAAINNAMVQVKDEIGPLELQHKKLRGQLQDVEREVNAITYSTHVDELLQREIEQEEKSLAQIHAQLKNLEVEAEAESRVQKVWEAEWQPKNERKRQVLVLVIPLVLFLIVAAIICWWDCAARRIHSSEEVTAGLSLPVVGAVPALPHLRPLLIAAAEDNHNHQLQESINGIRTMLLRHARAEQTQVVMVVSAVSAEGKTTLASNLALSLAQAGRKTLLVDCDLRSPAVHQVFEQPLQPGFSEVLLGEVDLPDAVRPSAIEELLWLLPAGNWDQQVLQELARKGPETIFEKLRQEFDFVIVDSHPVLPATDSLLVGQCVDAVIVSLMREVSQMHHVHEAWSKLATLGIHVFGAVINGVPAKTYGGRYQYGTQPAQPAQPIQPAA